MKTFVLVYGLSQVVKLRPYQPSCERLIFKPKLPIWYRRDLFVLYHAGQMVKFGLKRM